MTADFRNLELAWALAFPQTTTMRAQAAVVGSTVFLPVADFGELFAIDVASDEPCFKWVYKNDIPLRTGTAYGELPGSGRKVLVFGDIAPLVHMIDATTGAEIWRQSRRGICVGCGYRLYVGTGEATSEPAEPTTDAILAIELATGAIRWRFQATANDIFLTGCMNKRDGLNCPRDSVFLDADFGASTLLVNRPGGRDIVVAGQKSSTRWSSAVWMASCAHSMRQPASCCSNTTPRTSSRPATAFPAKGARSIMPRS